MIAEKMIFDDKTHVLPETKIGKTFLPADATTFIPKGQSKMVSWNVETLPEKNQLSRGGCQML
jgi:hypothetical protein